MADSDNNIEFLDEDADIVQQCVQLVPQYVPLVDDKLTPLLVERQPPEKKRKRKKVDEDDSDYDPNQDYVPPSPPSLKGKKKKQAIVNKKVKTFHKVQNQITNSNPNLKLGRKVKYFPAKETLINRTKCSIRIPDYDDPLCLPVKAIKQEESDIKRLTNWNNVCLEHFKQCDTLLKPERGDTHSSTRTVVFRNVINKQSGKSETTIWSKTCVENDDGDRKSEIFQCVLPRYKEKKVLTTFGLIYRKVKPYDKLEEVVLSKEEHKDGEVLVVYKPKEKLSAVYKLVTSQKECKDEMEDKDDEEMKIYMKELLCCKMCVPCFQTSWRGVKKNEKKSIACPICSRASFATIYNLLAHFRAHSADEMKKFKFVISNILAEIVEYHYKCRVCREQFSSIKRLRQHLASHQGTELFKCEVCNHMTR